MYTNNYKITDIIENISIFETNLNKVYDDLNSISDLLKASSGDIPDKIKTHVTNTITIIENLNPALKKAVTQISTNAENCDKVYNYYNDYNKSSSSGVWSSVRKKVYCVTKTSSGLTLNIKITKTKQSINGVGSSDDSYETKNITAISMVTGNTKKL